MDTISKVKEIMTYFAEATGLSGEQEPPRRYLWTDAFGVCNFLELYRVTGDEGWRQLALRLVEQVHHTLGRHREDDPRTGWISGLSEEEGRRHPTMGGLRIGKEMKERGPSEPFDERMEWDRDGQYYHYLTKWMHALNRVSRVTGEPEFNGWAIELAKAAHSGFVHTLGDGSRGMFWKMSIDLSYPLVPAMGQHDPLDGFITYTQLQATAEEFSQSTRYDLHREIADIKAMCSGKSWVTDDPLGLGGLLSDAYKITQLNIEGRFPESELVSDLLDASLSGLSSYSKSPFLSLPAEYRLAFRELGLSIGLHAVERMERLITEKPDLFPENQQLSSRIERFGPYRDLGQRIEKFWLAPQNREAPTWMEHRDINGVMLATSLAPDGYLEW